MRKKWLLRRGAETLILVRRAELYPQELYTFAQHVPAGEIERWLADSSSRRVIVEIYEYLHGRVPAGTSGAGANELQRSLSRWLGEALRRGRIIALLIPKRFLTQAPGETEKETAAARGSAAAARFQPAGQKTWIEIELIDAQGRPAAGERFRLELPDGTFHEDALDANGRARVDNIDPGHCELNFPDRDLSEWRAA